MPILSLIKTDKQVHILNIKLKLFWMTSSFLRLDIESTVISRFQKNPLIQLQGGNIISHDWLELLLSKYEICQR